MTRGVAAVLGMCRAPHGGLPVVTTGACEARVLAPDRMVVGDRHLVGVKRNRPAARGPWFLLAAGVAMFIDRRQPLQLPQLRAARRRRFPSYVDVVYLAVYPLLIAAWCGWCAQRSDGRDRASVDRCRRSSPPASVSSSWVFLIAPVRAERRPRMFERLARSPTRSATSHCSRSRCGWQSGRPPAAGVLVARGQHRSAARRRLALRLHEPDRHVARAQSSTSAGSCSTWVGRRGPAPVDARADGPSPSRRRINAAPPHARRQRGAGPAGRALRRAGVRRRSSTARRSRSSSAVAFVLVMVRIAGLAREVADESSETRFRTLIDNASDAILVLDGAAGSCVPHAIDRAGARA